MSITTPQLRRSFSITTCSDTSTVSTAGLTSILSSRVTYLDPDFRENTVFIEKLKPYLGQSLTLEMPDGGKFFLEKDGSYRVEDKDAKITYKAASRHREFNPYLNASDMLEKFIKFCGEQKIRQDEVLSLPINLFIGWLILEAAKADKEPEPDIKLIPNLRKKTKPKCMGCGRFLKRIAKLSYCAPICFELHFSRIG